MKKALVAALSVAVLIAIPALADNVVNDDQVVDGNLCVGQDCVNNQPFGFDTIILKENNTRILFDDTSSSGSFPQNDWRLVANDSSNGGLNRFSIENATAGLIPFSVMAGAPQNALVLGGIGLGLGTPAATELHMASGDTPTHRYEQTGIEGWDNYTWDVGGNESNFFVRDGTAGIVPLRILSGADDDALVISAGGVEIAGTLTQGSSRSIKHGISVVGDKEILAKLDALSVQEWAYIEDPKQARHFGPMAEDFYDTFHLGGDDKHLAPGDVAGVAIASVKALRTEVLQQAKTIQNLRAELLKKSEEQKQLDVRLSNLEKLMSVQ